MNLGPLRLLVLQPTPFCNIDCSYCYLAERGVRRTMSDEVAGAAFGCAFSSGLVDGELEVLWHAGEPLVAGVEFYRRASRRLAGLKGAVRVSQCIQTNATLIDAGWCELFLEHGFEVGVSLDGPERIHDAHRRTRSGKGTFRAVMRGVEALRSAGVTFSVLAVLTRESLRDIGEVLDFFEAEGLRSVAFNLEELGRANPATSFGAGDDPLEGYRAFARAALERHARGTLKIREIAAIEERLGPRPAKRVGPLRPLQFVTVDAEGGFSTFCPELHGTGYADGTRHVFGNVLTHGFLDVLAAPHFLRVYDEIMQGAASCAQSCERFELCGSHRVGNKLFENGTFASTETLQCRTRIKVIAALLEARAAQTASPRLLGGVGKRG